jgi:predicted nuclease of predicted toxin-antitoxin system
MRLLADENVHADLVAWPRANGQDVAYAAETHAGASDEAVLGRARDENRIVMTDDKDFGDLVVHRRLATAGVLLIRLRDASITVRIARLARLWPEIERNMPGNLVVVSEHKIRVRALPHDGGT